MQIDKRACVIAKRELFANVHEKLGRYTAAENGIENVKRRNVRILHAVAEAIAHDELALSDAQLVGEFAHGLLNGVHAYIRADIIVDLSSGHAAECIRELLGNGVRAEAAAVEDLDRAGHDKAAVMLGELLIIYIFRRVLGAEARYGKRLVAAHLLDKPLQRPRTLVV